MAAERVHVSLSVDPDRVREVARSAAGAGLTVEQVLEEVGIVTGTVDAARLQALAGVDGVEAVEAEHTFQLPPPESPLQ